MTSTLTPERLVVGRRRMIAGGVATGVAAWATPSVLGFDAVGAAVGSCGVKPQRVDFSRWANSLLPTNFMSDDNTVAIEMTVSNPGVQDATWAMRVFNGTLNGRDNPVITGMSGATNGVGVDVTFDFSIPVRPSFFLVDVDASPNSWQDDVIVRGSLGGGPDFAPTTMTPGAANSIIASDTVRGVSSTSTTAGNVEVDFDQLLDRITIRHIDVTTWTSFQWIGIHDFHWC